MSLMKRAACAVADDSLHSRSSANPSELLREQVYERIPATDIAAMAASNPVLARSEIMSACREVFHDGTWIKVDTREREELVGKLLDSIFGYGPIEGLLADETVTEIMVNATNSVYYERDGVLVRSESVFSADDQVRALIDRIIGPLGKRIDEASPTVDARLPQGHRVHAIIPPLALDGPILTIRKFAPYGMTLDDMVATGSFDRRMKQLFLWAVAARKNIAVSGGTGTGKTTLLNALSCEIPKKERIITIEDSAELRFREHPHVVRLEARPRNAEGFGEVTIRDLVIGALRMRPDRIVVGECRGAEALDMLQAMNTGHDGSLTTLHANAPEEAVMRLTTMVRYGADLPVDVIETHIASAIDLIVQIARASDGARFVSKIAELSHGDDHRGCSVRILFDRSYADRRGSWSDAPVWIEELPEQGVARAEEVAQWKAHVQLCG
ncbi:CpaF family protein [Raoultibacter phocaeensis]|uniref:CpaF family protein n=1 Tax=Raoultibacter phocaeensis TaxID=2479841 RepID=UPI0011197831|nr:CpaF family protein [Raoultibacter phocaeensis]